jgi:hypothetical protein
MWRLVAENFENHLVHLVLDLLINFHGCTHFFFFNHSFIHLHFFFSFFLKHTASAMAKQLPSVSLNMLATEGSDFNWIIAQKCSTVWGHPAIVLCNTLHNNINSLGAPLAPPYWLAIWTASRLAHLSDRSFLIKKITHCMKAWRQVF